MKPSIDGLDEAIKNLKKLPVNIQKNVLTGATYAVAGEMRDEARRNAPIGESEVKEEGEHKAGLLKKSITAKRNRRRNRYEVGSRVGIKSDKTADTPFYAHMVEYGTRLQPPNPFMRKAFDTKWKEGIVIARKYTAQRLPKEIAKLKAK
jgi:HK97 gp10 family phage protein